MVGGVVRGRLVLPEFLPVLAQLLERSGLGLDSLAPSVDEEQRRRRDLALKEAAEGSDDELERYAARAALRGEEGAADPALPVIVDLAELDGRALRRLLVPGALLLGVPTERLRPGPRGREVLDFSGAESESEVEVAAEEAGAGGLLVVCEVAYDSQDPASGPRAALVERLDPPVCSGAEAERGEAYAWAEALCRLHAGAVFVAPEHQEPLAELLAGLGSPLAALSARSGAARARLGLALLRAARAEEAAAGGGAESPSAGASAAVGRAALGLGASSPCADASAVVLLLEGRDALPLGALACGVLVEERAQAHAVACSVGGGRRQAALQLTRRGLPRGRIAPDLPPEGALLAGSLFRRSELGEPGPPEEPVLSLVPPQGRILADLLAQQVGLRVLQAAIAGGRPERVQSCRRLLEARCPSVRAEISADGREASLTGERGEAEAGAALLASLREERREVPKALGSRIVGRGGAEVRKLQEESGVLSLWVQKSDGGPFSSLEAFGEVAALERLDELLRQRHAHRSVAVSEQLAWRIVGKGGVGIRQLEEASGASLQVNSRPAGPGGGSGQEASRSVDAMGEAEAVEKAVALVQQRVVPSARVEIPRRVVSLFIGKGGAGVKELEAASGAWLSVLAESDPCIAEICGDDAAVARAQERIGRFLEQNAFGSLEVSAEDLPMVVGRSWAAWREIQASTGASVTVDQSREPATVGVAGARGAVDAALARLRERAAWERRRLELPWRTAAHMVGRGGGGLRELERLSGAALWAEQGRGETCAVEITGDAASVASAADLIAERTATVSICVPEAAVAHVIGKCGATIKSIECNSGALVQIVDTTVQLSGLPEARAKAVAKVKAILASGNFLPATAEAEGSDAAGVAEMPGVAAVQGLAEPASLHEAPAAMEADEEKNEVAEEEASAADVSEVDVSERPEGGDASAEHSPQAGDEGHDCRAETGSAEALSCEEGEAAEAVPASAPAAGGEPAAREPQGEVCGGAPSQPLAPTPKVVAEEPLVAVPSVLQSPTPARSCRGRSRSRQRMSETSCVKSKEEEKDLLSPKPIASSQLDDGGAPGDGTRSGHAAEDAPSAVASCSAVASGCTVGLAAPSQQWAQRPPPGSPAAGPPAQRRRASAAGSRRRASLGLPQASASGFLSRVSVGRKRRASASSQPPRSVRAATMVGARAEGASAWPRSRSRTPARGCAGAPSAAAKLRPKVALLDGMNILRSSNTETSGSTGTAMMSWGQLEQACRFYDRRRCRVSVFLPPVRAEHEPEFQRLRQLFGDIFVICQGGGSADDLNMINTVKVMEDQLAHEELRDGQVPDCRIVTNDGFRDWQRSGHVDAAWVERYCIRYAFGPLGFMPTCSSEWFGMQA